MNQSSKAGSQIAKAHEVKITSFHVLRAPDQKHRAPKRPAPTQSSSSSSSSSSARECASIQPSQPPTSTPTSSTTNHQTCPCACCALHSSCNLKIMRVQALSLLAIVLLWSNNPIDASTVVTDSPAADGDKSIDYTQIDLHALSQDELVAICTDRGFELVSDIDDATGEPLEYEHEHYVEAAKECLALEAEMEQYLEQNPDGNLLKEMEEERERMIKENAELERQVKEAKEKVEAEKARKAKGGTAFVDQPNSEEEVKDEEKEGDVLEDEADEIEGKKSASEPESGDEVIDLDDIVSEVIGESHSKPASSEEEEDALEEEASKLESESESDETKVSLEQSSEVSGAVTTGPLSSEALFKEVTKEFFKKVRTDFKRIYNIVVPKQIQGPLENNLEKGLVLAREVSREFMIKVRADLNRLYDIVVPKQTQEPLKKVLKQGVKISKDMALQAFDMIKRYSAILFEKGVKAYEKRKEEQKQQREAEEKAAAAGATTA